MPYAAPKGASARTGLELLTELLGPRSAEAAPWKEVVKVLQKLGPREFKRLSPQTLRALEALTEEYPSVRAAGLSVRKGPHEWFPEYMPYRGYSTRQEHLLGNLPGSIRMRYPTDKKVWGRIDDPMRRVLYSTPPLDYAHEAGHAFTGASQDLSRWLGLPMGLAPKQVRPSTEGFAEGLSHALLGQHGQRVHAPYWRHFRGSPSEPLYTRSGYLGAHTGRELRSGRRPRQEEVIEELMDYIRSMAPTTR